MNLSIRQLATFREVMRSGSISEAARTLGRTQPAVSSTIAGLETELELKLFMREQGRLVPTPEAEFFLEEAEAILKRLEISKRTLRGLANREHGQLRIAGIPEAAADFLPNSLSQFIADKPSVKVALASKTSAEIEELIAAQQFDIGFTETPRARNSFDQIDFDLECMCAIPATDPLASREVITPAELDGYPLALMHAEHRSHKQTLARFRDAGVQFNQRFELQTALPGLHFVQAGLCALICDMITAYKAQEMGRLGMGPPMIVFRPFRPRIQNSLSILTPTHRPISIVAKDFCDFLSSEVTRIHTAMIKRGT
ncbi:LysR substrate-binding domain-containing protein [Labrenzia sp. OB1]|uniref:LysR substrate-binding domain-containing protein n=1 Tax=Labrenzia sp. OB1 TaxID=1561204 RepID=UPI0007B2BB66|nr:LysR substrate-binding domain-containing protein [Labrenzia sp. OB1]KZM50556.1 LysR family transcriptional regulator [Labrenzia sp. OB1]